MCRPRIGVASRRIPQGGDILQHEVRSKISLMPEDAPGGNTDSEPDTRIYLRIYKFVNFFEKSACTVLES